MGLGEANKYPWEREEKTPQQQLSDIKEAIRLNAIGDRSESITLDRIRNIIEWKR